MNKLINENYNWEASVPLKSAACNYSWNEATAAPQSAAETGLSAELWKKIPKLLEGSRAEKTSKRKKNFQSALQCF